MAQKIYDIVLAKKGGENQTFWRTIGTVFGDETTHISRANGKPITFVIDYPEAQGIIVPRKKKAEKENAPEEGKFLPGDDDPNSY